MSYQSPICLSENNTIHIEQFISLDGFNTGATYNDKKQIFEINDHIVLKLGKNIYKLVEYHFHLPSEHNVCNKTYPSEIHYVFLEFDNSKPFTPIERTCCPDICGGCFEDVSSNILVIGRTIKDTPRHISLDIIQTKIPSHYFEYDGTLTTGNFLPVRWIIGKNSIEINIKDISDVAKTSRPIQTLDGRIILYRG